MGCPELGQPFLNIGGLFLLSNRLKNVVSQVNTGNLIADIGTDHGYVPIYLIKNSIAKKKL